MGRPRWTNRLTVEECPIFLCVNAFRRSGMFDPSPHAITTVSWPGPLVGTILGRIDCVLDRGGSTGLRILIPRQWAQSEVAVAAQEIPIVTTRPHLGGERRWFLCSCQRRAGRLYVAPGSQVFRCRQCCNLTYRSVQTHDQRRYDLARDLSQVGATLLSEKMGRQLLGVGALALWLSWSRKETARQGMRRTD